MKFTMQVRILASFFASCCACLAWGGSGTVTGREPGLFTVDRYSVIVARIIEVKPVDQKEPNPRQFEAVLEPLALIAGTFDPSESAKIREQFTAGEAATLAIHEMPPKGAVVLVVITGDYILSSAATFMPGGVPLVVVKGIGDERVAETLSRIREARAHPSKD